MKERDTIWQLIGAVATALTLLALIVGVWVDTKEDITRLQVQVQHNKEMIEANKIDLNLRLTRLEESLDRIEEKLGTKEDKKPQI